MHLKNVSTFTLAVDNFHNLIKETTAGVRFPKLHRAAERTNRQFQ